MKLQEILQKNIKRVLLTEDEIQRRVKELADEISRDYSQAEKILMIGILKGAFIFLADLSRQINIPHSVDFMAISSYGKGATSTGAVRFVLDLREPIENQQVVIVEDIIDTGATLKYLYKILQSRQPASLRTCVLLKKQRQQLDVPIDYLGFEIPNVWVVGYGLDYADTFRTLPYIAELKQEIYQGT
ncbi:MAG: hypoxanthine phosphoribosyltransferase [Chloroflexota bacterium]